MAACRNRESCRWLVVKFRAVTEDDRRQITEWIINDPAHAGIVSPDSLMDGNGTASVYALEDDRGTVMYVRQEPERERMRIHIQFGPSARRSLNALKAGYPIVKADAKNRGFKEIVFDSLSPALIRSVVDLGFTIECKAVL